MLHYIARRTQIMMDASIAVMVSLNPDATDIEMVPLLPRLQPRNELASPEEYAARKLRPVGVVGLCGAKASCAFNEPLEAPVVD